ncbi:hypothetical protein P175DRAFT_0560567 [Aspergillus ochraceoroseus IBT 24754]|uniref:Uncharacterized protein n=1 Tax=Aspergillus ochraceoroseus IBT 24754 TaxID=1392256 RepID=A0A2T5LNM5_9EURO|nr:uncharacterized protein P175DRAFT_0560567 [Aspergillus ochraceoroseus IBT 24754]PTU17877.1 hypothetical protein P175DRAFT_0560567 [Aspergillus ochraceoroseus IBT 24754]
MDRELPVDISGEAAPSSFEAQHSFGLHYQTPHFLPVRIKVSDEANEPNEPEDFYGVRIDQTDEERIEQMLSEAMNTPLDTPVPDEHDSSQDHDSSPSRNFDTTNCNIDRPDTPQSTASTITEPFPDYYESCEANVPPAADRAQEEEEEEAYNYAISKVVDEVIRFGDVDKSIYFLPFSLDTCESPTTVKGIEPVPPAVYEHVGHDGRFTEMEARKMHLCDQIQYILLKSDIKFSLRKRFTALTNMIIEMEYVFWRGKGFPRDFLPFLTPEELFKVKGFAIEIVLYACRLGSILHEEARNANRVRHLVAEIANEKDKSVLIRFRNMSQIILQHSFSNLTKPRSMEQHLLEVFYEIYTRYFYHDFMVFFNHYIQQADYIIPELADLHRISVATEDILRQGIYDYNAVAAVNLDIKDRFLQPAFAQLSEGPAIWQQCVMERQCLDESAEAAPEDEHHQRE